MGYTKSESVKTAADKSSTPISRQPESTSCSMTAMSARASCLPPRRGRHGKGVDVLLVAHGARGVHDGDVCGMDDGLAEQAVGAVEDDLAQLMGRG